MGLPQQLPGLAAVGRATGPELPFLFGRLDILFDLRAVECRPCLLVINFSQRHTHAVAVVVGAKELSPSVPTQRLFVFLEQQVGVEKRVQCSGTKQTPQVAFVKRLAADVRIPSAFRDVLSAWFRAACLVQLPQDARQTESRAARNRFFLVVHHGVELDVQFPTIIRDPRPHHQLTPLDPVKVAHRRLAIPVDHVHEPDVFGQHGVERAELAAAKDQFRSELGSGITGPDPGDELRRGGDIGQVGVHGRRSFLWEQRVRGGIVADQACVRGSSAAICASDPLQTQ